jgi:hypothetical protein
MATKLTLAGCDSASSLPMQQVCMPQQQQQQQQVAPNPPQQQQQGSGGGIDPTKLHNWQPQTSLLDSRTNDSTGGSSLNPDNVSGPVVGNAADVQQQQQVQPQDSTSWGMQSAGGGLWLGGEFAPSNMPSSIDLPPVPHGDEPVPAMPGLQEALEAAAAAQQQQQQQQMMMMLQGQQQGGQFVQWLGLAGPAAAAQQQQAHPVQQGGNVVLWPGLAGPAAAAQQQQQQQQRSGQLMQLNGTWQEPSSVDPSAYANSLSSSSGVYLEGSSTADGCCMDQGGLGGMPTAAAAAAAQGLGGGQGFSVDGRPLLQPSNNNMATIAEEGEQLTSGTGTAVSATAAAAAAAASNRV